MEWQVVVSGLIVSTQKHSLAIFLVSCSLLSSAGLALVQSLRSSVWEIIGHSFHHRIIRVNLLIGAEQR